MSQHDTTLVERLEVLAGETQRQIAAAPPMQDVTPAEKLVLDIRAAAGLLVDARALADTVQACSKESVTLDPAEKLVDRFRAADPEPVLGP